MPQSTVLIRSEDSAVPAKALPANIEAEAAYLGAVLIDNRVLEELRTPIRPEHFFEPLHQRIYERILKLVDRNATASPVTHKPYFEGDTALSTGSEERRGGKECVSKCRSRWGPVHKKKKKNKSK